MSRMRTARHLWAAFAAALVAATSASAARAEYPERPVTFVVPYAPGGAVDLLARLLGQRLEERLGTPFVIENRVGASSAIAAAYVAKSPPDGYTILMATSTTMAINSAVFKKLTYTPLVDLSPLALIANSPFVLVVNNALPVRSVTDLVQLAKSKPGELSYGSSGPGSAHHLDMQLLASMTGIKLTHVPYKGTVPALNDVVAGHIQMMFADSSAALPMIRSGTLRALGVSTAKRIEGAPELPSIAENGLPGYDASAWQMVVAPSNMPKPVVEKLYNALRAIQEKPDFRAAIVERGMGPLNSPSPDELEQFVKAEIVRWSKVAKDAGVAQTQ
jgi:tripartite-type tricarboxylate transporter receptor subunit TctC